MGQSSQTIGAQNMRKEIKTLRKHHDTLVDQIMVLNKLVTSFDSNLTKDERIALLRKIRKLEKCLSELKSVVPLE